MRRYKRVEVEAADDYKITLGGGEGRGGRGRRNNNEGGPSATAKNSKTIVPVVRGGTCVRRVL